MQRQERLESRACSPWRQGTLRTSFRKGHAEGIGP